MVTRITIIAVTQAELLILEGCGGVPGAVTQLQTPHLPPLHEVGVGRGEAVRLHRIAGVCL